MVEVEKIKDKITENIDYYVTMRDNAYNENMRQFYDGAIDACRDLINHINTHIKE